MILEIQRMHGDKVQLIETSRKPTNFIVALTSYKIFKSVYIKYSMTKEKEVFFVRLQAIMNISANEASKMAKNASGIYVKSTPVCGVRFCSCSYQQNGLKSLKRGTTASI